MGRARLGAAELHLFVKEDHDPGTTAAAADLEVDDADEFERMLSATGSRRPAIHTTLPTAGKWSTSTWTTTSCGWLRRSGPALSTLASKGSPPRR
jgi:hypothetical protein